MAKNYIIDAATARGILTVLDLGVEAKEKDRNWAIAIIRQIPGYEKALIVDVSNDRGLRDKLIAIAAEEISPTSPKDIAQLLEDAEKRVAAEKESRLEEEKKAEDFIKEATPAEAEKVAAKEEAADMEKEVAVEEEEEVSSVEVFQKPSVIAPVPEAAKDPIVKEVVSNQVRTEEAKSEEKQPSSVEISEILTPLAAEPQTPSIGVRISPSLFQAVGGLAKKTVLLPITLPVNYFLKAGSAAVYGENKENKSVLSALTPFTLRTYGVDSRKFKSAISSAKESGRISAETSKKLLEVAGAIRKMETGSPWYIRTVFWAYGGNQVSLVTDLDRLSGGAPLKSFLMSPAGGGGGFFINDVAGEIGQRAVGGLIKKGVAGLLSKLGISAAAGGATAAGGAAAGATAGSVVPVVGTIVGAVVGWISSKLVSWISKHKDVFFGLVGAGVLGIGFLVGSVPLMLVGGLGVGVGAAGALGASPGGVLASGASALSAGMVGLASLTVASLSASAVVALVALPVVVAIILFIINSGAYIVPPSLGSPSSIESPYIDVVKKVTKVLGEDGRVIGNFEGGIENTALPIKVSYQVSVGAKKGTLTNISFQNVCQVTKEGSVPSCAAPTPDKVPPIISPVSDFVFEYEQEYSTEFGDSFVTDIFTVTADAPEQKGATAATSAVVKIGAPPEECPSPWPVGSGYITQGAYSGPGNSHRTMEAIDIGVSLTPVSAGHSGKIVKSEFSSCLGNYIEISSSCKGKSFVSQYAHLEATKVKAGQSVTLNQVIGLSGNTGSCTTGSHLHYRFKFLPFGDPKYPDQAPYMMPPYLPREIPRGCGETGSCNVSF